MAAKKKETGVPKGAPASHKKYVGAGRPKGSPTYPMSTRTLEIIVHAAHDGEKWIDLPREAGKGVVLTQTGDELITHLNRLEMAATDLKDRVITIHANATQAEVLEQIAHRLTLYLPSSKNLPAVVDHAGWNASKPTDDPHLERKCQLIRPTV